MNETLLAAGLASRFGEFGFTLKGTPDVLHVFYLLQTVYILTVAVRVLKHRMHYSGGICSVFYGES